MPYKIVKTGDEYCVHKENTDGSVGEKVACHASKGEADEQVSALYASEGKSAKMEIEIEIEDEKEDAIVSATSLSPAEMGYRSYCGYIESAWDGNADLRYSHVRDVFPDHIIVAMGYGANATMYKVMYEIDGEDVEFDKENMTRVQLKTEWVTKSESDFNPYAVKSLGDNRIGAFAVVFGNEEKRDIDNQWFEKSTEGYFDVFSALKKLPWFLEHAADGKIKSTVIAEIDKLEMVDDVGIWYEAKILEHDLYKKYVSRLIGAKALYSSSGAVPWGVKAEKTGFIARWPIAEVSGTTRPADYHQVLDGHRVEQLKSFYRSLGIHSDEIFEQNDDAEQDIQQKDAEEAAETLNAELVELEKEWLLLQQITVSNS